MMISVERLAKSFFSSRFNINVLWNLGSLGILAASGILINGLILAQYNALVLGVFNQVFAFYTILSQFAVGGVHLSVLQKVSHNPHDLLKCGKILNAALLIVLGLSAPLVIILTMSASTIGDVLQSPDVGVGIVVIAPGLVFFSLNKVLVSFINGLQRMRAYAIFQALRYILIMMYIVMIIILKIDPIYLPLALTFAELTLFLITAGYIFIHIVPFFVKGTHYVIPHLSFGIRGIGSGVLLAFNTRVDVLMLGWYLNDTAVGVYSFAAILIEGFAQIPVILRYNIDPLLGKHFADNALSQIEALSRQIRRYFVPIMLALGAIGSLAYPVILYVLSDSIDLQSSWTVFIVLACSVIIASTVTPFRGIFLQSVRPGLFTILIIVLILNNLVLNVLLIPLFGLMGAAFATASTNILEMFLLFRLSRRYLNIKL